MLHGEDRPDTRLRQNALVDTMGIEVQRDIGSLQRGGIRFSCDEV